MHYYYILVFIAIFGWTTSQDVDDRFEDGSHNQLGTKTAWDLDEAMEADYVRNFNGTWISDTKFCYLNLNRSIRIYNAALRTDTELVSSELLQNNFSTFEFSPDNTKILIRFDVVVNFDYTSKAKYAVVDIVGKINILIHNGELLQCCAWSPRSDRLACVYNNNVYLHFPDNSTRKMTRDGINGVIYNGVSDWIYNNEIFLSGSTMWWSMDGYYLAVGCFNDSNVETFKYFRYGAPNQFETQYPEEVHIKYPKAGRKNPVVYLKVFDLRTPLTRYTTIRAPVNAVSNDHILQSVAWNSRNRLLITWSNRRQNNASIQLCRTGGSCSELTRIEEPNGWLEWGTPTCLKKSPSCLIRYWIGNWYQVWLLDLKTGANRWQSHGNFTVLALYGYDEDHKNLYYQATLDSDASIYHVFRNDDCLTCNLTDTDGVQCLSAAAVFSKDFTYYAATCNGPNPFYTKVFETGNNREVKDWEANTAFRMKLSTKLRPNIEFMRVILADGSHSMVKIQFPPNLKRNKTYPMIVQVNGAPNSVAVNHDFKLRFPAYLTTNREVIYVEIDGRGTGNKGKDLLFAVNNNLGVLEVVDQFFIINYLRRKMLFIDANRCGIWGSYYGGYMTARILADDPTMVFRCGISIAPVTSWLNHNAFFTERYMGSPTQNFKKYLYSGVLQRVDNFMDHDFMLIHGSADTNIHHQHSLLLSKVLLSRNIPFSQMIYTDENSGFDNSWIHGAAIVDNFWTRCLNLNP